MRPLCLLFLGLPLLAACSGSGANAGGGATIAIGDGGASSTVTDNGGGLSFEFAKAFLTRGGWCGSPPPLTPGDAYSLVLEAAGADPAQRVTVAVPATSPVGVAQPMKVLPWKAGPALKPGENDVDPEEAVTEDARGNSLAAFSLSRGLTPSLPDPDPFDQATLTVVALPAKEGDAFVVRIQLHFTDDKTLDETFTSVLAEQDTPCAGSR